VIVGSSASFSSAEQRRAALIATFAVSTPSELAKRPRSSSAALLDAGCIA
jgi:hypothetical protein